jgi:predicted acetyltransferase
MKVELLPATFTDKAVLANLMQLYLYEFPYVDDLELGDDGRFTYHYFDRYWGEPGRHPFLIRADDRLTGFVLVAERRLLDPDAVGHAITEFFVVRRYRRRGIGETAARAIFAMFPGPWWVAEVAANASGQAFWRATIDRYTAGRYEESTTEYYGDQAVVQTFDNSAEQDSSN